MKQDYEKPKIIIEFFPGHDIVTFSGGGNPGGGDGGGWGDDTIGGNSTGPYDA